MIDTPFSFKISDTMEQTEIFIEVAEDKKFPENTCLSQESNLTKCILRKKHLNINNIIKIGCLFYL